MPEISLDLLTFYETTKAIKSMEGKRALERAEAESRARAFTLAELIWPSSGHCGIKAKKEAFFVHTLSLRASVTEAEGSISELESGG